MQIEVGKEYVTKRGGIAIVTEFFNGWYFGRYRVDDVWYPMKWDCIGTSFSAFLSGDYYINAPGADLVATSWRDKIPWECIRPEVQWIAWSDYNFPFGTTKEPIIKGNRWVLQPDEPGCCGSAIFKLDGTANMPTPDCHWTEAIVKRPEGQ